MHHPTPPRIASALGALLACALATPHAAQAADVTVTVDWGKPTGREATSLHYGLNLFKGSDPTTTAKPAYKQGVAQMHPGLVRLHHAGLVDDSSKPAGLVLNPTTADYRWDAAKIKQALDGATPHNPVWTITIPHWPRFLGSSSMPLAAENVPAFAKFCADLVKIVNVDLKRGVKYFEILNEREEAYKGRVPEMVALIRAASAAMKAVDPTIKVGGPAFIQPWHANVKAFVEGSADFIDFLSYHTYQTDKATSPTPGLFKSATGLGSATSAIRGFLKGTTRPIELFHNEYNISYNPPDARMNTEVGAVFDALTMIAIASSGATGGAGWNEADGWYGKLDASLKPRPGAYVYRLFNGYMTGAIATSTTSASDVVTPFAVSTDKRRAIALVNRDEAEAQVTLTATGPGAETRRWTAHQVTSTGLREGSIEATTLALPPRSITVLAQGGTAVALPALPDGTVTPLPPQRDPVVPPTTSPPDAAPPATPVDAGAVTPPRVDPPVVRRDAGASPPPPAPEPEEPTTTPNERGRSGGCAVTGAPSATGAPWLLLLGAVALGALRRRRPRA
jgi:xylan 1,4-beta-xylosidase